MTVLSVVHDEWSAAMTDRLVTRGLVDVVNVANTEAQRAWGRAATAVAVPVFTEATATGGQRELTDVDEVLVWGLLSVPRWLSAAAPTAAWYRLTATCQGEIVVADPVQWCLRHGQTEFTLGIHRSDTSQPTGLTAVEAPVRLVGPDYRSGLDVVADEAVRAAAAARSATPRQGSAPFSATTEALPLDRLALRIDWSAPAVHVTRLIQSAAGRMTTAWTYLDRFPVSVGAAESVAMGPCDLAPGTIIRRDSAGVVVQTGDGRVRVTRLRDAVGTLPVTSIRPGSRFGIDPDEELRMLWRRTADLERTVQWIAGRVLTADSGGARLVPAGPSQA